MVCLAAVGLACVISYSWMGALLDYLLAPVGQVVFTSPGDAFAARLQLTFITGCLAASPVLLYQIWKFAQAGLRDKEKKSIIFFIPVSVILFLAGVAFGYFVAVPFSIHFLLGFASDRMIPMITIQSYISFVGSMLLGCGIVFEMPLVMAFLTKIGIATPAFLIQKRRHMIVVILIISAIITPPDVFSQIIMAIPLLILYEIGVMASKTVFRNRL